MDNLLCGFPEIASIIVNDFSSNSMKFIWQLVCRKSYAIVHSNPNIKQIFQYVSISKYASMYGYINLLDWVKAMKLTWCHKSSMYAAMNGAFTVLIWMKANGYPIIQDTYDVTNNPVILKWLLNERFLPNQKNLEAAAACGKLKKFVWMISNMTSVDVDVANIFKRVDLSSGIVQWLVRHGYSVPEESKIVFSAVGDVDFLKQCYQSELIKITPSLLDGAIVSGDGETLKWVLMLDMINYVFPDSFYGGDIFGEIVEHHDLNTIIWVYQNVNALFKNPSGYYIEAARNDKVGVMEWLYGLGYPCPYEMCSIAAVTNDDINALEWIKMRSGTIKSCTFRKAVKYGNIRMIGWLLDQGVPWKKKFERQIPVSGSQEQVMRWSFTLKRLLAEKGVVK